MTDSKVCILPKRNSIALGPGAIAGSGCIALAANGGKNQLVFYPTGSVCWNGRELGTDREIVSKLRETIMHMLEDGDKDQRE